MYKRTTISENAKIVRYEYNHFYIFANGKEYRLNVTRCNGTVGDSGILYKDALQRLCFETKYA